MLLKDSDVNLVFNVAEGINNNEQLKSQAVAMLESLQIPFTGSNSLTVAFCQDKIITTMGEGGLALTDVGSSLKAIE